MLCTGYLTDIDPKTPITTATDGKFVVFFSVSVKVMPDISCELINMKYQAPGL